MSGGWKITNDTGWVQFSSATSARSSSGPLTSTFGMTIQLTPNMLKAAGMYRNDVTANYRDGTYIVTFRDTDGKSVTLSGTDLDRVYEAYDTLKGQVHMNQNTQTRILTEAMNAIKSAQAKSEQKKIQRNAPKPIIPLIGDTERGETLSWLSDAFADGKLLLDEFNTRMEKAMAARHQSELDKLTQDLGPRKVPASRKLSPGQIETETQSAISVLSFLPYIFTFIAFVGFLLAAAFVR